MRWHLSLVPLVAAALALAQEPAFQRYGREHGLPHDQVRSLHQDARGYVWVATAGRVCRHDGSLLREWPLEAAAPERIDRITAGADGRMVLGGSGPALWLYDPAAAPCFSSIHVRTSNVGRNVAALAVDAAQRVFVATEAGLFTAEFDGRACELRPLHADVRNRWYGALANDEGGRVLYANSDVALRVDGDQRVEVALPHTNGNVWSIAATGPDRCLVLGDKRLLEVDFAARSCRALPLPSDKKRCTTMCTDRRGRPWIGTLDGVWRLDDGEPRQFLAGTWVQSLWADRAGDVWVGTQQGGLVRISARPFEQLRADGANGPVRPVRLLRAGDAALVATERDGLYHAGEHALAPSRFAAVPQLRRGSAVEGDSNGNLWFATGDGLLRVPYDGSESASTWRQSPLPAFRLFADARGNVLCSTPGAIVTMRADADGAVQEQRLLVPPELHDAYAVTGDGDGTVYCFAGTVELWRLGPAGATRCTANGAPLDVRRATHDGGGRLWLVPWTRTGFAVVDPREAAWAPRWIRASDGLPGDSVMELVPDGRGGAWLAFASALCHFDAGDGRVRTWPWPANVGLAGTNGMLVEGSGRVLIATDDRVIAFDPAAQLPSPPPPVLVTSLLVDGTPMPLPDGGTNTPSEVTTPAARGNLTVTFCAPGGATGAAPVQHRLLPSSTSFGPPERSATLQLASLAWGEYRLEVRAAALDGMPPGPVTALAVHVPPPLWWRPEFLACAVLAVSLGALFLHRVRTRRLVAMEAVRRQIALDLHDDLGSGLAQVAVLSEVCKREAPPAAAMLTEIGDLARGMRESMSDIVWAVDPKQDTLAALVQRLRQVAGNLFGDATEVRWNVPAEAALATVALAPDRRRHLFLFAKEALTNVARHADSEHVTVDVVRSGAGLRFAVTDAGRGFDPATATAGSGLRSLQVRANALGGALTVRSQRGRGTTVELSLPASRTPA